MSRDFSLYLHDINDSCNKVREYVDGLTFETFSVDPKTIDAVVRNLEIIGEAVKCLPPEWRESQNQINWKKIARVRDIIAHHYFKVDLEIVWNISQEQMDDLEAAIQAILKEQASPHND